MAIPNLLYEIARYDVGADPAAPIERFRLRQDGTVTDPVAVIAATARFSEVRPDQITRVTAPPPVAAQLPMVLTVTGDPADFGALYVNGERWVPVVGPDGIRHLLPGDRRAVALAEPWLTLSFTDTAEPAAGGDTTQLGLATPMVAVDAGRPDPPVGDGDLVRVWRRDATPGGDAQIVLSWLRGNALAERVGVDTAMLVQLFIEAAVHGGPGVHRRDGEFLATLAGPAGWAGTTAGSEWTLTVHLAPEAVEAVLAAIADSGPRWRYAIVAAQDPDSPAGRVRTRLLADLDR